MPLLTELESVFGLGTTTMPSLTGLKSRLDGVSPYREGLNSYRKRVLVPPPPVTGACLSEGSSVPVSVLTIYTF